MTDDSANDRRADRPPHGTVTETPHREGRPEDGVQPSESVQITRERDPLADWLGLPRDREVGELREAVRRLVRTEEVGEGEEAVAAPAVPDEADARLLTATREGVRSVGGLRVIALSITEGHPEHGELMSHPHVSRFEAEFSARDGSSCPDCGSQRYVRRFNRHHNISLSDSVSCLGCGTTLARDEF